MYQNRITDKSTPVFLAATVGVYAVLALIWTIMFNLTTGLVFSAVVTLPTAILGWFILSLILFIRAKKRGDDALLELKHRLKTAIVLLIFLAVMIALLCAFFACAISHM